jgi:hypothetical protein
MFHLVVLNPFDGYERGDIIDDPIYVTEIINGDHRADVVQVTSPHPHLVVLAEQELASAFGADPAS